MLQQKYFKGKYHHSSLNNKEQQQQQHLSGAFDEKMFAREDDFL